MALILSTIDDGQITSSQARAFHQSASQSRDVIFPGYGSSFATQSPTGFTAQVGTGMLLCDGVICENTSIQPVTMTTPTQNGIGALVAVINLANKTFSFKMQNHANSFIRQNLVEMQTGTREVPLYFFSYTTTAITSWDDWRPLGNNAGTPAGTIVAFAGDSVPNGWLYCNGGSLFQVKYPELYAAIGTKYGGGNGKFNLPDLRARTIFGSDARDGDFNSLGKTGGSKTHTLTVDEMPSHSHLIDGSVYADKPSSPQTWTNKQSSGSNWFTQISNVSGGVRTVNDGGGQPHNNLPPYIAMNYIIKY